MAISISSELRECLALFEAFRKLGYKAEDIYFMLNTNNGCHTAHMVLRAEGKEFVCDAGSVKGTPDEIQEQWRRAGNWWNSTTEENREAVWRGSHVFKNKMDFLMALHTKGFKSSEKTLSREAL
jgi:hypothetical protein